MSRNRQAEYYFQRCIGEIPEMVDSFYHTLGLPLRGELARAEWLNNLDKRYEDVTRNEPPPVFAAAVRYQSLGMTMGEAVTIYSVTPESILEAIRDAGIDPTDRIDWTSELVEDSIS